jgi:hypothetical protein
MRTHVESVLSDERGRSIKHFYGKSSKQIESLKKVYERPKSYIGKAARAVHRGAVRVLERQMELGTQHAELRAELLAQVAPPAAPAATPAASDTSAAATAARNQRHCSAVVGGRRSNGIQFRAAEKRQRQEARGVLEPRPVDRAVRCRQGAPAAPGSCRAATTTTGALPA